ncbi:LCCL domain-containing protein [Kordiimonas gwangyangensis]|uniref:LCCL domain-containing protein n=1 Tax=Kordiimonas gwangyangensis TaxID=288022 RepID=UPI0003A73548|nr:LCCL domain-containing protein [Kordiimonas gwangyangensis]
MNQWMKWSKAAISTLILVTLAACSSGNDQPSEDDIKNAVAFTLPSGLEVADVEILVTENAGTQVEPLIRNRSNITLEFTDDFVMPVARYDDKVVLKKLYEKGQELKGTLISSARLKGDSWTVSSDRFDITRVQGNALSQYAEGSYAFEGTDEAATFKKDYEDALVKAEEERQAAIARAAAEKAERIAAFRKFLTGTWTASGPMMRNGGVHTGRDGRATAGLEMTFPEGDEATGVVPMTLYVQDNPVDSVPVNAGFTVSDDGKSVKIRARSNTHKALNIYMNEVWTMGEDGVLQAGGRDRWTIQMEKDGEATAAKKAAVEKITAHDNALRELATKHSAGMAPSRFRDMRMNQNTYTNVILEATPREGARVFGAGEYDEDSNIALTAIHAGVLKEGEAGVVKITYRRYKDRPYIQGTTANGVTSERFTDYGRYSIELVEKLK